MKLRQLNYSDLNSEFLKIISKKHEEAVLLIISCCGSEYYYNKILNEDLWRYDIVILEDLKVFFGLQDMFEFCKFIDEAIKIKTLQTFKSMLN